MMLKAITHPLKKKFYFFLSLTLFVIETYYRYLQGLQRRKEGEILDPQLTKWSESLSRFKFEVKIHQERI